MKARQKKTIRGYVHDVNDFLPGLKQIEEEILTIESLRRDPFCPNKRVIQDQINHLEHSAAISALLC
jgi:hypothetical protein